MSEQSESEGKECAGDDGSQAGQSGAPPIGRLHFALTTPIGGRTKKAEHQAGIDQTGFEEMEKALAGYPDKADRAHIRNVFNKSVQSGDPINEVIQIVTNGGGHQWVRIVGRAVHDDSGQIVALDGAFKDVSAPKKAQFRSVRLPTTGGIGQDRQIYTYFTLDSEWCIVQVNTRSMNALTKGHPSQIGRNFWEEYPELRGSVFEVECNRATTTGEAFSFDFLFQKPDLWFRIHLIVTGQHLDICFHDISEERKSFEHLRLLDAAVAQVSDVIVITDANLDAPDGPRILYANAAFERVTGYGIEEILGKTPRINQGERTDRKELRKIREALRAGQPVRAEILNYRKDGTTYWKDLALSPIRDQTGRLTNWVSVARDLTEARTARKALYQSEERFRLLAKATSDAIWDWDMRTNEIWWNDGATALLRHCSPRKPKGIIGWARIIHREDFARFIREFRAFLAGDAENWTSEFRFLKTDGTPIHVVSHCFVSRDASGVPRRIVGSVVDITEKTELEERLRRSQRMEALGQLTGGISHDFNNLLTVIMGNLELLMDHCQTDNRMFKLAETAMSATERGADLTSRLLAFSSRQLLTPVAADLNNWLVEVSEMGRRGLAEDTEVLMDFDPDLWPVEIDHAQFETSVLNLIINANRAMPKGGKLTIKTVNFEIGEVLVGFDKEVIPGEYVMVSISDTGVGMTPEIVDRIFEPFFTTHHDDGGTGLGLSMVYGFVRQSGGHILVYSMPGVGTSIKLYFPRCANTSLRTEELPEMPEVKGKGELVLVVEDNHEVRESAVAMLESLGYRTLSATSGRDAMATLRQVDDVEILFTDVIMPGGINGQELATAARELHPDMKVLFTSGYTRTAMDREGRIEHGAQLLLKPYLRRDLSRKLRGVLDQGALAHFLGFVALIGLGGFI